MEGLVNKCNYCGFEFVSKQQRTKFCSRKCRNRDLKSIVVKNKGYCKVCCKDISHKRASAQYCDNYKCVLIGKRLKTVPIHICTYCGKKYKPLEAKRKKDKTPFTFCSKKCRSIYLRNGNINKAAYETILKITSNLKEVIRYVKNKFYVVRSYEKTCPVTGKKFIAHRQDTRYSKEGLRRIVIFRSLLTHSKNWIEKGKHKRICNVCGKHYTKMLGDNNYSYQCSNKCNKESLRNQKRVQRATRRARKRKVAYESVNAIKVFDRDKWKCQLCGITTPRELRGKHADNSPELDHIIPLSKGGPHTYNNVQCLCRLCNRIKSDSIESAQLVLSI